MKTCKLGSWFFVFIFAIVLATASASAQGEKSTVGASKFGNVNAITAAQLEDYLTFIAADELEGRDTPSRGLNTAAKFIATHLSRAGLTPAGDEGTFFQRIALRRTKIDPEKTRAEINGERFIAGRDFLAEENAPGTVSAPLVYVGQCWTIKAKNIEPSKRVSVKDKIIITHADLPKEASFRDFRGKRGEDWESPSDFARRNGARGMIMIPGFRNLVMWERDWREAVKEGKVSVASFQKSGAAEVPTITVSPAMLAALFEGEQERSSTIFSRGCAGDPVEPFDLSASKTVSFTVAVVATPEHTQNVVAVLEGSDGRLKREYVALGAHYDHVGIGRPAQGDSIYNGADDDGSGTVAVMAMAEAFAAGPRPKRSLLFVWHAGEERGLWGSKYLTENPPVPLSQIVTQLNLDMIGRSRKAGDTHPANDALSGPEEIYVIGSKMMSTELGALSESVNQSFLKLAFNYRYDDPQDPNRFFFRSDHYNYAQKGIPIIFYFDGTHADYHKPSDSIEKIDYQKMEKVARAIFATAWELANLPKRPVVDKTLPPELTAN